MTLPTCVPGTLLGPHMCSLASHSHPRESAGLIWKRRGYNPNLVSSYYQTKPKQNPSLGGCKSSSGQRHSARG